MPIFQFKTQDIDFCCRRNTVRIVFLLRFIRFACSHSFYNYIFLRAFLGNRVCRRNGISAVPRKMIFRMYGHRHTGLDLNGFYVLGQKILIATPKTVHGDEERAAVLRSPYYVGHICVILFLIQFSERIPAIIGAVHAQCCV